MPFQRQCLCYYSTALLKLNSQLSINLLSRQRASVHTINKAVSVVDLPVTACFFGQGRSTIFSFVILEEDLGFEMNSYTLIIWIIIMILNCILSVLRFVLSSSDRIAHHKTGYGVMLLHWLCVVSALGLLLYGSRLITIYTVMTSVCETVVGIAARRPSMTL